MTYIITISSQRAAPPQAGTITPLPPRLRQLGWNTAELQRLVTILRAVLRRFKKISPAHHKYSLHICPPPPDSSSKYWEADYKKSEFRILLGQPPARIFESVPLCLATGLVSVIFDELSAGSIPLPGIKFNIQRDEELIEQGIRQMIYFYRTELRQDISEAEIREAFMSAVEEHGLGIMRHKIIYALLSPYFQPFKTAGAVRETAGQPAPENQAENRDRKELWSEIASVVQLATLAKKYSCLAAYEKCLTIFREMAGRLAANDFLSQPAAELAHYQQYPQLGKERLKLAGRAYNILFNSLQSLFEHYFDSVSLKLS